MSAMNVSPACLSDGVLDTYIAELAAATSVSHPNHPKAERLVALRKEKLRRLFEVSLATAEQSNVLLADLSEVSIS